MLVVLCKSSKIMEGVAKVYILKKVNETKNNYFKPRSYIGANVGKF